jgi:hypothetical protein
MAFWLSCLWPFGYPVYGLLVILFMACSLFGLWPFGYLVYGLLVQDNQKAINKITKRLQAR